MPKRYQVTGPAPADVHVDVPRIVVQIDGPRASLRAIVPVAAAKQGAEKTTLRQMVLFSLRKLNQPAQKRTDFRDLAAHDPVLLRVYVPQIIRKSNKHF